MPPPADPLDELRAQLRRLWRGAAGGRWEAPMSPTQRTHLVTVAADGSRTTLAAFERAADAELAAAVRNGAPLLWRAIDDARPARPVPVLGEVVDGGAVIWNAPS